MHRSGISYEKQNLWFIGFKSVSMPAMVWRDIKQYYNLRCNQWNYKKKSGVLSKIPIEGNFQTAELFEGRGVKQTAIFLLRMSNTYYLGFISREYDGQLIPAIPHRKEDCALFEHGGTWSIVIVPENKFIPDCCSVKDHSRSAKLIPILLSFLLLYWCTQYTNVHC